MEAYSSFLLVFKGNITGKKGPEKSQKKQIFSVEKKAGDEIVWNKAQRIGQLE